MSPGPTAQWETTHEPNEVTNEFTRISPRTATRADNRRTGRTGPRPTSRPRADRREGPRAVHARSAWPGHLGLQVRDVRDAVGPARGRLRSVCHAQRLLLRGDVSLRVG